MCTVRRGAKHYVRSWCRTCDAAQSRAWRQRNKVLVRKQAERRAAKEHAERRAGVRSEVWIWRDSRRSDRKHGRLNNLTKQFIADLISSGCIYCGETKLRMTLDRVDNNLGHLQDNVVPCCIRCNYIRRDMPHEAWLFLRAGLREARERAAFGNWTGRIK